MDRNQFSMYHTCREIKIMTMTKKFFSLRSVNSVLTYRITGLSGEKVLKPQNGIKRHRGEKCFSGILKPLDRPGLPECNCDGGSGLQITAGAPANLDPPRFGPPILELL